MDPRFDAILSSARDNNAQAIHQLVRAGCPPSYGNRVGQTALHIGALWGSVDAVQALIEARANVNAQNQLRGSAPLHAAAMGKGPPERRAECVKLLIAAGADARKADFGGERPLDAADAESIRLALGAAPLVVHKAVQAKAVQALEDAIRGVREGSVDLALDAANQRGETALFLAAGSWNEGVRMLLAARADVHCGDALRRSPLHAAAKSGDFRSAAALLAAGAAVNAQDVDGDRDPRYTSSSFEENEDHRSALHYAAELGNAAVASALLSARGDPNARDSKLFTPLHLCLEARGLSVEDLEPGRGVRVKGLEKKPELNGRLASVFGPATGNPQRWPVLVEGEDSEGMLLKSENLELVHDEVLDLLLEAKADVNLGNHATGETRTVLHEAARSGDAVLVAKALAARANVDQQDAKLGLSALHLAARSKHHEVARLLVEAGADTKQATAGGKTAAELGQTNGAAAATLALLGHQEPAAPAVSQAPQKLASLTPEQRAAMFLD